MDVSPLRARSPAVHTDVEAPGAAPKERALREAPALPKVNGLAAKAPHVDPPTALPPGVRCVRRATPQDAEAIAAIQEAYQLRKIDAADHPKNGWLLQKSTPDAIRFSMNNYKSFFVAESDEGKVVAFQAISAARFISRPSSKHKFFGPHAKRALRELKSGRFIYMSQIAASPNFSGKGLAAALQTEVLKQYRDWPLVAHVACFTQDDFDAKREDGSFEARTNNIASHKYHQKHGYRLVAWTSDLAGTEAYNSGLPPPDRSSGGLPGVMGALYVHFRDGAEDVPHEYVDPVEAVLAAPCAPGEADSAEWSNPFPDDWHDPMFGEGGPPRSERVKAELGARQRIELLSLAEAPFDLPD